ncbi:MAG: hypothetical protein H8E32_03710 [Nitrospinae bacterium]|nr:hypothetical protein [Nitrospinota bacterium]
MTISPKKILLVHEDRDERGRLAIMLSRFGHEVRFSDGTISAESPWKESDLFIVNERLVGKSGIDLICELGKEQQDKIIYLTSGYGVESRPELQEFNIYEHIFKPIDPLQLAVVVCDFFVEMAREPVFEMDIREA